MLCTFLFSFYYFITHLTLSFSLFSSLHVAGLAPEATHRGWDNKSWLHLDQRPLCQSTFDCVQGWVTGEDIGQGDATLRVLVGSHKFHGDFATQFGEVSKDWFKLNAEQIQWYLDKGCVLRDITCAKGSQVLWDSRTVHSGRSPVKGRKNPRNRYIVYTCYWPTSKISAKQAEKKRKCVLTCRMTTHWPDARAMVSKKPCTYGKPCIDMPTTFDLPILSSYGASLFGWHEDPSSCPLLVGGKTSSSNDGNGNSNSSAKDHVNETKRYIIYCDSCDRGYQLHRVGITKEIADGLKEWLCGVCLGTHVTTNSTAAMKVGATWPSLTLAASSSSSSSSSASPSAAALTMIDDDDESSS